MVGWCVVVGVGYFVYVPNISSICVHVNFGGCPNFFWLSDISLWFVFSVGEEEEGALKANPVVC